MIFINKDAYTNDELFNAVLLEQMRNMGFEIEGEKDGYDIQDKTPEEIEELKKAAQYIAKHGGPEYGIYRNIKDFGFDKE